MLRVKNKIKNEKRACLRRAHSPYSDEVPAEMPDVGESNLLAYPK